MCSEKVLQGGPKVRDHWNFVTDFFAHNHKELRFCSFPRNALFTFGDGLFLQVGSKDDASTAHVSGEGVYCYAIRQNTLRVPSSNGVLQSPQARAAQANTEASS